jgi:thiol-disulfide isomerase/thioredoxin
MKWQSLMEELGTTAPGLSLAEPATGRTWNLAEHSSSKALLVAFLCNHCPFVLHILDEFVKFAAQYQQKGLLVVAVSSNDVDAHPEDGPAEMARLAAARHFSFPYLYDESQAAAKAFRAVCTPDFFLYDDRRRLVYRGQFDGSRPRTPHTVGTAVPITGADLRYAVDAVLAGRPAATDQMPSMGCSMKWKPGYEPDWG